jgi:pyruvate dehydrogenase E2 component (dihydrolipoamide acetyltransferase)
MPEKILMTALSPTMETGTLARWRKKEGDTVANGDVLCEVETDKATMDYESTSDGTLLKILLAPGGQAKVGDPIAIIGKPGEDIAGLIAEAGAMARATAPEAAGRAPLTRAALPRAAAAKPAAPAAATGATGAKAAGREGRLRSSPLARRLAAEKGVALEGINGSGPGGRIVQRDLDQARAGVAGSGAIGGAIGGAQGRAGAAGPAGTRVPAAPAAPAWQPGPGDEVVPVSRMRAVIARRLSDSMYTAPHFYLTVAVDMEELLAARTRINAGREKKASLNAFLMALAGRALARHPQILVTWNGDTVIRRASADIALAVALPDGLVTPLVRDCGRKGIISIDAELAGLIERARSGKLTPQEYEGATFTISNLGAAGIDEFTAIINPPGSAILAVGAVRKEAVVGDGDAVVVRQRMRVTLSCDHRVIDGAVGAAFLRELADMLENPLLALA